MAPSDNVKIVFGVVAAAGVVFVSYLFFRIFGTKVNVTHPKKGKSRKQQPVIEEKIKQEPSITAAVSSEAKRLTAADESGTLVFAKDECAFDEDNSNQTSFIILDHGANESLPCDEGPVSSKKSDRSSDDSSFDVVEAGGEEEDEENRQSEDSTLLGQSLDNESSMVILDSGTDASGSSFYHTAKESLHKDSSRGKEEQLKKAGGETSEEIENSDSISTSGSEPTVMRSLSKDGAVSDSARASGNTKDELATGDEKKVTSDPETISSFAVVTAEGGESVSEKTSPSAADLTKGEIRKVLTSAQTTSVLTVCQNSPGSVKKDDIFNLVELLRAENQSLQPTVLDCIVRVSAFTHNSNHLCEAGCGWVMSQRVQGTCSAIVQGDTDAQTSLEALSGALTNISMNPKFQSQLEGSVSPLIDVLLHKSIPEPVQLSTLRPLTNLSSESTFHHLYRRSIQFLYNLLDGGSVTVRIQSLKVLVNLSLNKEMVPHLLAAKPPNSLLDLLDDAASVDVILRTVTLLSNILSTMSSEHITQSSVPTSEKAESSNTMYKVLGGVSGMPLLRNKVARLKRHWNEDISQKSSVLNRLIEEAKK